MLPTPPIYTGQKVPNAPVKPIVIPIKSIKPDPKVCRKLDFTKEKI